MNLLVRKGTEQDWHKKTRLANKAGCKLYLDALRANGFSIASNSPFSNPWVDLSGQKTTYNYTNALVNGNFATDSNSDGLADNFAVKGAVSANSVSGNIQSFTASVSNGGIKQTHTVTSGDKVAIFAQVRSSGGTIKMGNETGVEAATTTSGDGTWKRLVAIQTVTGTTNSIPYIASADTSDWKQIDVKEFMVINLTTLIGTSGSTISTTELDLLFQFVVSTGTVQRGNNATPINMVPNNTSGVNSSNQRKPGYVLDGNNDYFNLVNSNLLNVTSAPLAVFSTFYINVVQGGWLFCKNTDAAGNTQYGLTYDGSTQKLKCFLNGVERGISEAIPFQTIVNAGFIWNGIDVKYYINQINGGTDGSYSSTLPNRDNVRIGCRGNNAIFINGTIYTVTVYSESDCSEYNVLRSEEEICRPYIR